ncbi:MAG: LysM peptidoglycan-binding domain-containing protein [Lachnospiraceae bacterium]|nr:LysM peptidoglycan-binding domain-containing protein [Lachnospiraceae bacterium]
MHAYMKKNERKARLTQHIILIIAGILAAIAIITICGSRFQSSQVQASDRYVETTLYKSVYVKSGDTLWTIADIYMDEIYGNKTEYIDEIREINHISGQSLQAGSYIIVPYTVSSVR